MSKQRKIRKIARFFTDDQCTLDKSIRAIYKEAEDTVSFVVTREHLIEATPGRSRDCGLAIGVLWNKKLFPHDVLLVQVIRGRVYILTRLAKGLDRPARAVRYCHNFTKWLTKFDQMKQMRKQEFIDSFPEKGVEVILSPTPGYVLKHNKGRGRTGRPSSEPVPRHLFGAKRRAKEAGLLTGLG